MTGPYPQLTVTSGDGTPIAADELDHSVWVIPAEGSVEVSAHRIR